MSMDLVLPEIAAEGRVPAHDLSLVRQLRSSWNVRLRTSWTETQSGSDLIDLEVLPGPTVAEFEAARDFINRPQEPASPTNLAKGLAIVTAVCAKPADFDDAKVVLWSERLKRVLQEYPAEIALASITNWPRSTNGKWWPTENEIRHACDEHMEFRAALSATLDRSARYGKILIEHVPPPPFDDGMSDTASACISEYMEELKAIDPVRHDLYLNGARFDDHRIGIKYFHASHALEMAAPGLLAKHEIRIVSPIAMTQAGFIEWEP